MMESFLGIARFSARCRQNEMLQGRIGSAILGMKRELLTNWPFVMVVLRNLAVGIKI